MYVYSYFYMQSYSRAISKLSPWVDDPSLISSVTEGWPKATARYFHRGSPAGHWETAMKLSPVGHGNVTIFKPLSKHVIWPYFTLTVGRVSLRRAWPCSRIHVSSYFHTPERTGMLCNLRFSTESRNAFGLFGRKLATSVVCETRPSGALKA